MFCLLEQSEILKFTVVTTDLQTFETNLLNVATMKIVKDKISMKVCFSLLFVSAVPYHSGICC